MSHLQKQKENIQELEAAKERLESRKAELNEQLRQASATLKQARRQMIAGDTADITEEQARVTSLEGTLSDLEAMLEETAAELESARQAHHEGSLKAQIEREQKAAEEAQATYDKAFQELEGAFAERFHRLMELETEKKSADKNIYSLKQQLGRDPRRSVGSTMREPEGMGDYAQAVFDAVARARRIKERLDRKKRVREAA